MKRYELMHRIHEDPQVYRSRNTRRTYSKATAIARLAGARRNCVRVGCDVRDSVIPGRPGFVAERDGRFYEAFEIVAVEAF